MQGCPSDPRLQRLLCKLALRAQQSCKEDSANAPSLRLSSPERRTPNPGRGLAALCTPALHHHYSTGFDISSFCVAGAVGGSANCPCRTLYLRATLGRESLEQKCQGER